MLYSVAKLGWAKDIAAAKSMAERRAAMGSAVNTKFCLKMKCGCRSDRGHGAPFPQFRVSIFAHAARPPFFRLCHRLLRAGL